MSDKLNIDNEINETEVYCMQCTVCCGNNNISMTMNYWDMKTIVWETNAVNNYHSGMVEIPAVENTA